MMTTYRRAKHIALYDARTIISRTDEMGNHSLHEMLDVEVAISEYTLTKLANRCATNVIDPHCRKLGQSR